jgi:signal transduction histidine kinase
MLALRRPSRRRKRPLVSKSPRRITLYWLLLLVPTLAVGAGALLLLKREQARVDEQVRAAVEARRAAVAARARLIAENVELLVGDAEDGLMATLGELPAANPDAFLDEWERTNPLVGSTFRLGPDGRILRPERGPTRAWLEVWQRTPPWEQPGRAEAQQAMSEGELLKRRDVDLNVAQFQNARSAVKDVANQAIPSKKIEGAPAPDRTGWAPWRDNGRLHVVGWRRTATGAVVGVELNLAAIAARLGELLPKDGEFADALAVRDALGATVQSKIYASSLSRTSGDAPEIAVPIAANVLPGWEVVGVARVNGAAPGAGGAFFLVGGLLVAIFVTAILSGGSLLLWQARRSEAEAAQKTSFVANVSHEFKTPLTTIRLYAELLEQGRVRDAQQGSDYLRTIGRETQRLARLVNNALDFSRLEQGRKKYALESLDLGAELTRLLDTQAPRLAEAGLALTRDFCAGQVVATADRDAFEQIVLNLVDNACKYAGQGGELAIALAPRAGGGATVCVSDRGPGVPSGHGERIFEKFHRVDEALTAEKSGAGLGLSIARQLARGLGGELSYADRKGGGAEFILELPERHDA